MHHQPAGGSLATLAFLVCTGLIWSCCTLGLYGFGLRIYPNRSPNSCQRFKAAGSVAGGRTTIKDVAEDTKEVILKHFLRTSSYIELFDILAAPKPTIQVTWVARNCQESLQLSRGAAGYLAPFR